MKKYVSRAILLFVVAASMLLVSSLIAPSTRQMFVYGGMAFLIITFIYVGINVKKKKPTLPGET